MQGNAPVLILVLLKLKNKEKIQRWLLIILTLIKLFKVI